ncbi:MAG TPA: hypothetical protein VGH44_02775 [Candidatus Saccharimonadia bacterium]
MNIPVRNVALAGLGAALTVIVAAIFGLGFNHSTTYVTTPANGHAVNTGQQSVGGSPSASALPARPWVVSTVDEGTTRMSCALGLVPMDLPVGSHVDPHATYNLTADIAYGGAQTDVRLAIHHAPTAIVAMIVHASGPNANGHSNDTEHDINLKSGGSLGVLVDTPSSVYDGYNGMYKITSLELCAAAA